MTSNPPDEVIHFRGKTLTPESPRPLHIPEPSNIPVLENQMDPVFNDTSTYEMPSSYQDDEQPLESDSEIYKSANDEDNRIQEALLSMAQESGTVNVPSILDDQSVSAHIPLPTEPNVSYHQMGVPISAAPINANTTILDPSMANPEIDVAPTNSAQTETGVEFQSLLDNISPSASTAHSGPVVTTSSPADNPVLQEHKQPQPTAALDHNYALSAGLPPRPPTQETPDLNPNYQPTANISDYHPLGIQASNTSHVPQPQGQDQHSNASIFVPAVAPGTSSGAIGLPPPPLATFQQFQSQQKPVPVPEAIAQSSHKSSRSERYSARPGGSPDDDDVFWGDEVQKIYDEFLREERAYVTEGLWDRFPYGSRLFVGNLPSERVTKRDLFHVFHKYGKLAQISIKQAYGFIQFLDSEPCHRALQAEQGSLIRGRKIHLEISKPQKSTRPGPTHPEPGRQPFPKRSRSPDYSRGGPSNGRGLRNQGNDRHDRSYDNKRGSLSDFREENGPRRRDDYRPPRSPSPRAFRTRESGFRSRDRTPDRFERRDRRRSRSPYGRDRRYRSPSPHTRSGYDGESEHAFSRRAPRDVPDLQVLAADDVDMSFAYHVENSFKTRGLRTNTLVLSRIPVDVAIQRQMEEGVFAVIRLTRSQQYSGKVTLLIFDRSAGASSKPRSMEYPDLDLHVAVQMTIQMHAVRRAGVATNYYPPNPTYPGPSLPSQFSQPIPHVQPAMPALPQPNQIANLIQTLDGAALQALLSTLQQAQSVPQAAMPSIPVAPNVSNPVDLASLLNNAHRQQNPLATAQNQRPQPQAANPFVLPLSGQPSNRLDPNLLALLAKGTATGGLIQGGQAAVGPQVQNIVNQLAKWKQ
ncbi:nuclear polyadenylated RNA-binding protein 3 [Talaromyces marneffei ATCC 18224]|uniref:RNA-binding protein (Nab3), putative n=1 Tax=Talaromyces marneffei (strain ATCC 18224 / CBS 334.59 / QM 7333) TaxID=441960 RepID=B6Q719_TALMQ|nr:uncharacterized protein EYB26_001020 [Talaromyces marneffei]EEA27709.1 RNA-binding protein (Nab3), putative [Talaromyces marneffei ATCC 18224]QGA13371.1 hypothetical protein EYB26_001020 [Talaromyces marneffei]